jgi:hypothetical protein
MYLQTSELKKRKHLLFKEMKYHFKWLYFQYLYLHLGLSATLYYPLKLDLFLMK